MTKEKTEKKKRAKERYSAGRTSDPYYTFKPRYTASLGALVATHKDAVEEAMKEEVRWYGKAREGKMGDPMKALADELGDRGIAEERKLTAGGVVVRDMITDEVYAVPITDDLSGLWELDKNIENPDADRRIKRDWRYEPVWEKGMRFCLERNAHGFEHLFQSATEALDEGGKEYDVDELRDDMLMTAGYLTYTPGDRYGNQRRLDNLPESFARHLRPVPLLNTQDAIDLTGAKDWNIAAILKYLVDDRHLMTPWGLATLLEQHDHREGPFEQEDDDDDETAAE